MVVGRRSLRQFVRVGILGIIIPVPGGMVLTMIIGEPEARAVPGVIRAISRGVHLLRRAPATLDLLGCTDCGIIPAGVQMILVAAATNTLAPPADEEETADAQTAEDDYESHDRHGDDNAQIYA